MPAVGRSIPYCALFVVAVCWASTAGAQSGSVGPLLKLLESGRVPAERQGTVVEMICTRGDAPDLAVVFGRLQQPDGFSPATRVKVLELLTDAAVTRKVKPTGELAGLSKLLESPDRELQLAAIRLASVWKLAAIAQPLEALATNDQAPSELRQAAIEGLVSIGDERSRGTIERLAIGGKTILMRIQAAAGLAKLDLETAAGHAADVLAACTAADDPTPLIDAILGRQGGADKLAASLAGSKLSADVAKVCLRHMYSLGRSDPALSDVLSKAAGIATDAPPPSQEEVARIAAEVAARGDAARGEKIFRRAELSCIKCHSVAQAGGSVGPELTALGSISPIDYVVNSILNPNLAIKEQYVTRKVLTVNGEIFTGIQIDRDEQRLRLRDASGKVLVIPADDIDQEGEGASLMPQGLTKFLTQEELLDLAKFVSELGKPGPYAIRKTPTIQRWRVLKSPSQELLDQVPNVETVRVAILDAKPAAWSTAYGQAGGSLPLAELALERPAIVYIQGEIQVNEAGPVAIRIASTEPVQSWLDAEPFDGAAQFERELPAGKHTLTLRIVVGDDPEPEVMVEVVRPEGSPAQFVVVNGM